MFDKNPLLTRYSNDTLLVIVSFGSRARKRATLPAHRRLGFVLLFSLADRNRPDDQAEGDLVQHVS
jgi:hypothetical protein